jgi:hypothetical protein
MPIDEGMQLRRVIALLAMGLLVLAGCGKSTPTASGTPQHSATKAHPSAKAKMICSEEAQEDIGKAIGVEPTKPVKATWAQNLYSCPYRYAGGTMRLSVRELSDPTNATGAYFLKMQDELGWNQKVPLAFGDGAFATTNGSVVVRKDNMVLLVDVRELPNQFGQPPTARTVTAQAVAKTIMGCWK